MELSGKMAVLFLVLFQQPATTNNNFVSPTNWSGCEALITFNFYKTKIDEHKIFLYFRI
jgi:hypothetical protein